MSCTVMYQPYAMSYSSSSCERTNSSLDKAPSPQDSLTSDTSSYNSPGPVITHAGSSTGGPGSVGSGSTPLHSNSSSSQSRRPLSPSSSIPLLASTGTAASSSHNINSLRGSHNNNNSSSSTSSRQQPGTSTSVLLFKHDDSTHDPLQLSRGGSYGVDGACGGTISPIPNLSHHGLHHSLHHHLHHQSSLISPSQSTSSTSLSSSSHRNNSNNNHSSSSSSQNNNSSSSSSSSSNQRAHYVSANCVVFVHYNGDVSRVVDEHFSRALSAAYVNDNKTSKCLPMSTRNFPPSFWNSNYQPSKPLASYGADFYGAAVDYGTPLAGLAHHHQGDPWHYPLPPPHQSYHSRPAEIPYPPMPSTSRFNAAQYGSFLLAGAAASSGAGRFPGVMAGSSQCGMKSGESSGWAGGRYHPHHHHHHHHESLSDLHLADYSAAAAAHYSNMTAGLDAGAQEATSKDLYWF